MRDTQFQEGDYVRFLNEKQEGTISKILSNGNVVVDIENDFPIEATPKELVKVRSMETSTPTEKEITKEVLQVKAENNFKEFPQLFSLSDVIYLAIVPLEQQVSGGPIKIYIINSTKNALAYSFHFRKNKEVFGIHSASIQANECIFIKEIKREDLFDYDDLLFEGLHFIHPSGKAKTRINKSFQLTLPDLSQEFPALTSPLAFTKIISLYQDGEVAEENMDALLEKLQDEHRVHPLKKVDIKIPKKENSGSELLRKHGLSPSTLEIDLHIEEITHSFEGLSNADIVNIQLNHFKKELDKCYLRQQKSIVFIHGIGNGKLKSEIRRELKELKLRFADGAYERYGYGATEVFF